MTDFRALCTELLDEVVARPLILDRDLIDRARAALAAAPEGKGPSESDVADLFYRHMGEGSEVGFENAIAEALARWGNRPGILGRPITPPPELVEEWIAQVWHEGTPVRVAASDLHVATQAARWGAAHALPLPSGEVER